MNRKRIFTVFMAVAIAGMLIALPYESNAILPFVAGLVAGACFGIGSMLLWNWLTDKTEDTQTTYEINKTIYLNQWAGFFEDMENMFKTTETHFLNQLSLYNQTKLAWVRYAEREVINYLDKTNWTTDIEENITKEFDNLTRQMIISFAKDYGNILADFVHEIYQFNNWTLSDTYPDLFFFIGDAGVANANWGVYNGQLWGNNKQGKFYIYVNDNAINLLNIGWENMSKIGDLYFYNDTLYTKTVSDLLNDKLIFGCYDMGVFIGSTKGCHYFDTFLVDNTGYSDVDTTTGTTGLPQAAQIVYGSLWGDYDKYNYEGYNIKFNEYLSLLSTSYNTIRTDMINNAQAYWTYLKNLGYDNASEVPEDLIPVYPDVLLDNIEALGNLTGNETFAMYYAIMQQLTEQLNDMIANNQTGNITWDDIMLGNFTGKQANIILQEATATTGTGTVLVNGWAYIIPYEQDLTLTVNTTYAITTNATLPSWANAKISQKISIYDIANHKWYYITPTDTTYYNLTVKGLMVGNQTTDSVKYDILDANDLAYATWGFRFVEIQNPEDFIIPMPQDENDIIGWLEEHKGLIIIACIVLGVILTGSSRKGTGGHTLGLLLLVAGIGMAIYFYILPAWNDVNSFFDKITFWD